MYCTEVEYVRDAEISNSQQAAIADRVDVISRIKHNYMSILL